MDISAYWQSIKKQSKELTGVKKMDSGIFHSSGIGGKLEDYIKAVKKGDARKIVKAAQVALDKTSKYVDQIHKKEMKDGKKSMSPKELKSAKIVGDALDKIIDQLEKVISGEALAGSFDGDATADARDSADHYIDPKLKKAADAHLAMRKRLVPESKAVLDKYKRDAAQVPTYVRLAKDGAAEAKTTKRSGLTHENQQAMAKCVRAVEEITKIIEAIEDYDAKNVQKGTTDFMIARQDFSKKDPLPDWFDGPYRKESQAHWVKVEANLKAAAAYIRELKGELTKAEASLDVAESNSMAAIDPAKLISKIEKLLKDVNNVYQTAYRCRDQVQGVPSTVEKMKVNGVIDPEIARLKVPMYEKQLVSTVQKFANQVKQAKTLRGRLDTILSGTEDSRVEASADPAQEQFADLAMMVKALPQLAKDAQRALAEAKTFADA